MASVRRTLRGARLGKLATAVLSITVIALFAVAAVPVATASYVPETIQAGGASFVNPVMQVWATDFGIYTGGAVSVNYVSSNAGTGEKDFIHGLYTFAGTDNPIPPNYYRPNSTYAADGPLLTIPETLGGVAVFYNIPGVTAAHPLNLTGQIVANIYLQNIVRWNDSAILALNPYYSSAQLSYPIYPVYRTGGAGVNYQLSTFLERTSPSPSTGWNGSGLGRSTTIAFPTGADSLGIKESGAASASSIATAVKAQTGAIGYTDTYSVESNHLLSASILNSAGYFVQPSVSGFEEAASADASEVAANSTYSITDAPTPIGSPIQSYPLSTYTYVIMWENQAVQPVGYDLANFLWWVVTAGQAYGPALYYGALPASVVTVDENLVASLNYQGTPFITIASATITCSPSTVVVGLHTKCTAAVTGGAKGGIVEWASNIAGTFTKSACTLTGSLTCSVTFDTAEAGSLTILGSYLGSGGAAAFNGQASVTVSQKASRTTVSCKPSAVEVGGQSTCHAVVVGFAPSGSVSFSQGGPGSVTFSSASCSLSPVGHSKTNSECTVTVTGATAGATSITASYGGDTNNSPSSKSHSLTVK